VEYVPNSGMASVGSSSEVDIGCEYGTMGMVRLCRLGWVTAVRGK
jgi:hypothetical protein